MTETQHVEYPAAVHLQNGSWLVSDGSGLLYMLVDVDEKTQVASVYHLPDDENATVYNPFRLHTALLKTDGKVVCILSGRQLKDRLGSGSSGTNTNTVSNPRFDIWCVELSFDERSDNPLPFDVLWHGIGGDIPLLANYYEPLKSFYVLGYAYRRLDAPEKPAYEPTMDELAPIPREDEIIVDGPDKPPPYSWTQTSDSVTIAFPLPSNIPKNEIHVTLTAKTLSLLVKHELPTSASLPRYSLRPLWDNINTSESVWTWDRAADRHFGLLTLHLDKAHMGTRWSSVFAQGSGEPEVPETLDPSELANIRDALEKYTSALQTGEDMSGLGLGSGVPSLAEGERDDSVDAGVGRRAQMTWLSIDGTQPAWAQKESAETVLLSTPFPGIGEEQPTLITRNDIDGILHALQPTGKDDAPIEWKHVSTYPALAFVLASKRDTRFRFHLSSQAVMAFESGTGFGGGNVFIYRGTGSKDVWAKQSILKVSGGAAGALLGVGAANTADGKRALLCLCERELVVVNDIL